MKLKDYIFFSVAILSVGCSLSTDEYNDLNQFLKKVNSQPVKIIEPVADLPKKIQQPIYKFANKRSPFETPTNYKMHKEQKRSAVSPDFAREKSFLEDFDLEYFVMSGYLKDKEDYWGLLKINEKVYNVKIGDYIGKNHGKIIAINKNSIQVQEIIPAGSRWVERSNIIKLQN